jgi:hypothetical protein
MLGVPRWTAAIPALAVAWAIVTYALRSSTAEALWMCNITNLILAVGIARRSLFLAWVATTWLVIGVPLWIWDAIIARSVNPHAFATHVVAAVLGVLAVRGTRPAKWSWVTAVWLGALVQIVSRMATPPEYNVNASHATYKGLYDLVGSNYVVYWFITAFLVGGSLWLVQWLLSLITIRRSAARSTR